jgi:CIC family chloride channel protein
VCTVLAVGEPVIFGNGLVGINQALRNEHVWWALLLLIGGKLLATALTLGSGASGGVFAPSLFMGAMLGAAVGQGANVLFPTATANPGAYSMVGMAAVFAGAAQAPISAILILFEMTNDYLIILPLMLSCIVATTMYGALQRDSIYLLKIRRKGVDLAAGRERHLLERTPVARAILDDFTALQLPAELAQVHERMRSDGLRWLICVDLHGRFIGMLGFDAVEEAIGAETALGVDELLDDEVLPVIPTESLDEAFRKIAPRDLRVLPVIDDLASRRVIGAVTRDSLTSAYWSALGGEAKRTERA